uniref:Uncharacterized protein n=1 Tax=Haptolina ericina TaxID=156174 RepID=A0A7S3AWE0_9EUKA|mmetsp:Transcript_3914/g.8503  ORF Transcript_3914/g.8503 Transcript_3914/m.8503 type:complete len:260 (+) Transcript_3914:314-1093(+)
MRTSPLACFLSPCATEGIFTTAWRCGQLERALQDKEAEVARHELKAKQHNAVDNLTKEVMQRLDNNDPKRAGAAFHKFQQKPGSPSKSARSPARTPVSGTKPSYSRASRSSASPLGLPTTPPKQSSNRSFRRNASPLAVRNTSQLAGPSADPPAPAASVLLGSALEAAAGPGRSQRSSGESTSSKGEKKKKKKKSKRKPNGALAAIDDALDDDEDEERGASGAGSAAAEDTDMEEETRRTGVTGVTSKHVMSWSESQEG